MYLFIVFLGMILCYFSIGLLSHSLATQWETICQKQHGEISHMGAEGHVPNTPPAAAWRNKSGIPT